MWVVFTLSCTAPRLAHTLHYINHCLPHSTSYIICTRSGFCISPSPYIMHPASLLLHLFSRRAQLNLLLVLTAPRYRSPCVVLPGKVTHLHLGKASRLPKRALLPTLLLVCIQNGNQISIYQLFEFTSETRLPWPTLSRHLVCPNAAHEVSDVRYPRHLPP